jgi:carbon-monoxide dehydrogenase medium subunit
MKPPPFKYLRPARLEGVLDALAEHRDDAALLAGGQSLVPLLNFRLARPPVIVDLAGIPELEGIALRDGAIEIGAMTSQRAAEVSEPVAAACPLIRQALRHVGHLQIRNRGTVGGSLAHADPAAELPAAALALQARLTLRRRDGEREVPASEFFQGPFFTVREPDEVLTKVTFEPVPPGAKTIFLEFARRAGDFALAGVAAVNRAPGAPADVMLVAMGVGGPPVRLADVETSVRDRELTQPLLHEAGELAAASVDPPNDVHADAGYRRELLGVLVRRALARVA